MYIFEYCEFDCYGFYVLVTRVTNMDATLNRKIMDATVNEIFLYLSNLWLLILLKLFADN